jgi:hypothetical protein
VVVVQRSACGAVEALEELQELQSEYSEWQVPENQQDDALAEKLDAIASLDIDGAIGIVQEAGDADLPLGFGRD